MLKAGQDFSELQDSYMVFITQTDIFGYRIPIYTINRHFEEIDDIFDDGSHIVYVNGNYKGDDTVEKYAEQRAESVRLNSLLESIRNLMANMKLGAEQAMNVLEVNERDGEILQERL